MVYLCEQHDSPMLPKVPLPTRHLAAAPAADLDLSPGQGSNCPSSQLKASPSPVWSLPLHDHKQVCKPDRVLSHAQDRSQRAQVFNWLFWQMVSASPAARCTMRTP